jgi:hypothetical protein
MPLGERYSASANYDSDNQKRHGSEPFALGPKGIDTPVSWKSKPTQSEEQPVGIRTSGIQGAPATEPVSPATLEPVSRL